MVAVQGFVLTINELPLLLDEFIAKVPVHLKAADHKILLPDHVVLEQSVRLYLGILDLELVDLAQEA